MKRSESLALAEAWALMETRGWLARRTPRVRELLYSAAQLRDVSHGESLYCAGDSPDGIYGLVRGALQASIPRIDGQEFLVHRAEIGFWIGDVAAFSAQKRLVSLRAAGDCRVIYLPQKSIKKLIDRNPELFRDFYELTHENTRTILLLLGNLSITSAEQRIALRLLMHTDMLESEDGWIEVSQETLAQMVALSPKTVRRTLRQLALRGLVQSAYAKVRIADREALAALCGYCMSGQSGRPRSAAR
jgi:CRP-like cAMP-binding protein